MITLRSEQFEDLKRRHDVEVFTQANVNNLIEDRKEVVMKSDRGEELDDFEKAELDEFKTEFTSLTPIQVIRSEEEGSLTKGLQYDRYFIREKQVEFDADEVIKSEDGKDEIVKARGGVYKDTAMNRKLGRVGQKFGSKKEGGEGKSEEEKIRDIRKQWGEMSKEYQKLSHELTRYQHPQEKELTAKRKELGAKIEDFQKKNWGALFGNNDGGTKKEPKEAEGGGKKSNNARHYIDLVAKELSKYYNDKAHYSPDAVETLRAKAKEIGEKEGMSIKEIDRAIGEATKKLVSK